MHGGLLANSISINDDVGMKDQSTRYARPALWGFFVCIAIAGVLVVIRFFVPSFVTNRWNSEHTVWRIRTEQIIRDVFKSRVQQLAQIAEQASTDTSLVTSIILNDIPATLKAFQILNSYRLRDNQTLDLVDPQGNVLAWHGPSITSLYANVLDQNPPERFVRMTQSGLRTYLTFGIDIAHGKLYLMVSEPLELNSPISNRFIQKASLSNDLTQKLNVKVTLRIPHTYAPHQSEFIVPVADREGKTIVEFSVEEESLDSNIMSAVEYIHIIDFLLPCYRLPLSRMCRHIVDRKQTVGLDENR